MKNFKSDLLYESQRLDVYSVEIEDDYYLEFQLKRHEEILDDFERIGHQFYIIVNKQFNCEYLISNYFIGDIFDECDDTLENRILDSIEFAQDCNLVSELFQI